MTQHVYAKPSLHPLPRALNRMIRGPILAERDDWGETLPERFERIARRKDALDAWLANFGDSQTPEEINSMSVAFRAGYGAGYAEASEPDDPEEGR